MLVVTSFDDLIKYLEIRRTMFAAQRANSLPGYSQGWESGAIFAMDEAIRAVQALNTYLEARELEETPLAPELIDPIDSENP